MKKKKKNAVKVLFLSVLICFVVAAIGVVSLSQLYPLDYVDIVNENAKRHDIAPELILAVIHAESRFNPNAVSHAGASGLMQIMESTAYWLAPQMGLEDFHYETDIFDPAINIRMGTFYLKTHIDGFGDIDVALAAYNAGQGNVTRWLSNPELSRNGKTLDHIPFPETENYISRVAANQRIYRILLKVANRFPSFLN